MRGWPAEGVRNAVDLFLARVQRSGAAPALQTFPEGRVLSWEEWASRSAAFAHDLLERGLRPGERVAIWADNRPVWPIADVGALMAGAVPVGIYPSSAPDQVRHVLSDARAVVAVGDAPGRLEVLSALARELESLGQVLGEDEVDLREEPDGVDPPRGAWPGQAVDPAADALLIYTSGSTGEPRGARISHRYLLASTASIQEALGLAEGGRTLSFLPYCHAAERIFGLYTRIRLGMEAVHLEDHRQVWEAAHALHPTLFGGLPRFYEKVYEELRALEEEGADAQTLVPRYFGSRLQLATSGGATLPIDVSRYLEAVGVPVLGAYGLTEHLCAAMNRPHRYDLATSGPPMPGTEIRIADDGEILLRRSDLTFSGYLDREQETRDTFSADGQWLLTGDLGRLDERGFLTVTGRKKELLALSTGKKVAPLPIEAALVRDPWISQAVLVGEGRKYVAALLVLSRPVIEAWARGQGMDGDWDRIRSHPRVHRRIEEVVAEVNRTLSRTEQVKRFHVLARELSQEKGELTPTLKLRREVILDRYRGEVEGLYAPAGAGQGGSP